MVLMRPIQNPFLLSLACSAAAFSSPGSIPSVRHLVRSSSVVGAHRTPLRLKHQAVRAQCSAAADGALKNVPVIDFAGFNSGDHQARKDVARQIFTAFKDIGFVTLTNHGVHTDLLKQTFQSSRDFFELQDSIKQKYKYLGAESNRGYLKLGHEKLADGLSDIKETFEIGNEAEKEYPNAWPDEELPEFKITMLEAFRGLDAVHLDIMRCIAIGLKLDPEYFTPLCDENHQNLRLLRYPSCERSLVKEEGQKRAGVHTDYGTITLVLQHDAGGLQAQRRDGEWIHVTPVPNSIVVNVGDCLMRWSNDVLVSTPHRVISDPSAEGPVLPDRFSIAFFCNPNKSTLVECLGPCTSADRPPKYSPINAFDYLTGRLTDTITR